MEYFQPVTQDQIRITALEKQVKELLAALASQQKQIDFLLNNLSVATSPSLGNPSLGKPNLSRFRIALIMVAYSTIDTGLYSGPIAQFLQEHIPECVFEVVPVYVAASANKKENVNEKSLAKLKEGSYNMGLILKYKCNRPEANEEIIGQIRDSAGSIPHIVWLFVEPTNNTKGFSEGITTHFNGGVFVGTTQAVQTSLLLYTTFEMKGATPSVHVIEQNLKNVQLLSRMIKTVQELS